MAQRIITNQQIILTMNALKTEFQKKKEEKDMQLYNDYKELRANSNNSKMEIIKLLMEKYGIYTASSVYAAVHRVERRLEAK